MNLSKSVVYYQVIQPAAKPNDSSKYRAENSKIGPLTGNRAVISPKHAMLDHITVPDRIYAIQANPGPATNITLPDCKKRPTPMQAENALNNHIVSISSM